MTDKRTLSQIMAQPERDRCRARFIALADQLQAEGFTLNDIARSAVDAGFHAAQKDSMVYYAGFLRMLSDMGHVSLEIGMHMTDRLGQIKRDSH